METRFNEVMAKYAEQQEHMEQLEHINTQLQVIVWKFFVKLEYLDDILYAFPSSCH